MGPNPNDNLNGCAVQAGSPLLPRDSAFEMNEHTSATDLDHEYKTDKCPRLDKRCNSENNANQR